MNPISSRMAAGILIVLAGVWQVRAVNWQLDSGTWDDSATTHRNPASVPVAGTTISLTQASAGNIAIDFAGNNPPFLTGTEAVAGTRYGSLTLGNSGGGVTTLLIGSGDMLPSGSDATLNSGGKLDVSGGTFTPLASLVMNSGSAVVQTGGLIQPLYYDLSMPGGTYTIDGGTSRFRISNIGSGSGNAVMTVNSGGSLTHVYDLTVGGGSGTGILNVNSLTVSAGRDVFVKNNGTINVAAGSKLAPQNHLYVQGGAVVQTGGLFKTVNYDLNLSGTGVYNATGGTVNARDMYVSDSSTFSMGPGVTLDLTRQNQYLTVQGNGTFTNNGGTILGSPTLFIKGGSYNTSTSTYNVATIYQTGGTININSGTVTCYYQVEVGKGAGQTATFNYAGGSLVRGTSLDLGSNGGTGTFNHAGNLTTRWLSTNDYNGWIYIGGGSGQGTYNLGDASGPGTITKTGVEGLRIGLTGTLHGRGSINTAMYGGTQNSGKVIADGFGTDSDLDLSGLGKHYAGYTTLANPVDNPVGGTAGWYAVNGGRLRFPTLGGAADNWQDAASIVRSSNGSTYNIGESKYSVDPTLDLVNSAQITFTGLSDGPYGTLAASLLAGNRTDVPLMTGVHHLVGVFDFALTNNTFTSYNLNLRYDDASASAWESQLRLYHYDGTGWVDVTAALDMTNKWISAANQTSFSLFAIGAVPEPAAGLLLALASGLVALRRGRRSARSAV